MTVFRFQENGHFLHMAHKCPACRLRQSGIVRTYALLASIWNSCGLSGCPDRRPACRDLIRTRNHAAVYTDAQLAGIGKPYSALRKIILREVDDGAAGANLSHASLWKRRRRLIGNPTSIIPASWANLIKFCKLASNANVITFAQNCLFPLPGKRQFFLPAC